MNKFHLLTLKTPFDRINSVVLLLGVCVLATSGVFGQELAVSTSPITQAMPQASQISSGKDNLTKAGIYNMGGKLFIDRNVEVSKGFRADRYLELVSTSAPLAPQAGLARFYMSNSSNTLCAIFPNGGIGCFGAGNSTSTVISGAINAVSPLFYDLTTGNLTLGPGTGNISISGNAATASQATNAITAGSLAGGSTTFIQLTSTLQSGATLYTSSGTIENFSAIGTTKLGTVTVGTWNATVVGTQYGGTSSNLAAGLTGALPYFNGNGVMGFSSTGTPGFILTEGNTTTGSSPVWISTNTFIQNRDTLQTGTTFYVSSATVAGQLKVGTLQSITTTDPSSLVTGTLWYNSTSNTWKGYDGTSTSTFAKELQIKQSVLVNGVGTTGDTYVATGLSSTITLRGASYRVKITVSGSMLETNDSDDTPAILTLKRNSTDLAGNNNGFAIATSSIDGDLQTPVSFSYIDTPGSAGPFVYEVYLRGDGGVGDTVNFNTYPGTAVMILEELPGL